jgi:AraC-like DNA-binding protein
MDAIFERRSYSDGFPLSVYRIENHNFHAHWHNEVECALVVSGQAAIGVNGQERQLGPGDVALAASNDIHYYRCGDAPSTILLAVFKPELVDCPEGWPQNGLSGERFFSPGGQDGLAERAALLLGEIEAEHAQKRAYFERAARAKLLELCVLFERASGSDGRECRQAQDAQMRVILEYIRSGASFPITLGDIARVAGMSPSHVSRLFAKAVGTSLPAYINQVRIRKAQRLLKESDSPIQAIAAQCGFESQRTFNRAFLASSGMSPNAWRKGNYDE